MKNVIITGASGMVGKAVLLECLEDDRIEEVLIINRRTIGLQHKKVKEVLLPNFKDISSIPESLTHYDACFFCMGVSSAGMSEEKYHQITFSITKFFVDACYNQNPNMVFNYVSGAGTDSTEKGKSMWARVKGKTENMIFNKGFKDAYAFRAGMIIPEKGITSNSKLYRIMYVITKPLFPIFKRMKNVTTTTKLGKAMINTLFFPTATKILHNPEMNILAKK